MPDYFVARVGLDWLDPDTGKPRRVEPGERCDDVPKKSRDWLLEQGLIEPVTKAGKPLAEKDAD